MIKQLWYFPCPSSAVSFTVGHALDKSDGMFYFWEGLLALWNHGLPLTLLQGMSVKLWIQKCLFLALCLCKEDGERSLVLNNLSLKGNLSFDFCCFSQCLRTIPTFSSAWATVYGTGGTLAISQLPSKSIGIQSIFPVELVTVVVSNSLMILF